MALRLGTRLGLFAGGVLALTALGTGSERLRNQLLAIAGARFSAEKVLPVPQVSSTGSVDPKLQDFNARCQSPGVVRCFGFESTKEVQPHLAPAWDATYRGTVDTTVKASGEGALRFEIPPKSPANTSGSFWLDFSDDLTAQFGEGDEFFVQWRQRFSPELLGTHYNGGDGWKQIIVGEGDRPGVRADSCTQLEMVVQNQYQRGFPQMYHSCGGKDQNYEPLQYWDTRLGNISLQNGVGCSYAHPSVPPCVGYKPNQWMTFQMHIKIGHWYKNDKHYNHDSTVQLWVAEEGRPSKLVIDFRPENGHGYDIANENGSAKYGKLWLLPYDTNKDSSQVHPAAYTWYDELVVSRARIPDPKL
jgi:hypothetical protein